jgi:nitrous oxide reductase accessory protein NosL
MLCFSLAFAGEKKPLKPGPKDKCPVCGMFVAKYPDWVAEVLFKDGSYAFFDGAKDLFKYYSNLKQYNPQKKVSDIDGFFITEYYNMTLIEGTRAYYVIGSDVFGPMGHELIPLATEAEAKEFMRDHKGKKILKFQDISPKVLESLN